jgi:signal transduction histidine kinase
VKRVRQIVVNLLSNALKFTPVGGRVTLRCAARAEAAGEVDAAPRDYVFIEVEDTGPGIDEAAQDRIFLPFVQLARAQQNPIGGVGLGLAISREFARGMGGDLVVRSTPGHGSTFILRLPGSDVCEADTADR